MSIKNILSHIQSKFTMKSTPDEILAFEFFCNQLQKLENRELAKKFARERTSRSMMARYFGMLPKIDIQSQFTGLSEEQTFLQALTYLTLCKDQALANNCHFGFHDSSQKVLDFGCGWGRITQLLAMYFKTENIIAADVMPAAINTCKQLAVQASYELLKTWPPSSIQDSSIDYIFGYSVFSHLSEDNADAWIREFSRILKPGGMAFLTTRHRSFFEHLASLHKQSELPSYASGAANAFKDIDSALKAYDQGQFCFDAMGSGGKDLAAVYGEAFIPPAYAKKQWGSYFSKIEYHDPLPEGLLDQATLIFCK